MHGRRMALKLALKAVVKLTRIDLRLAVRTVRHNPLLETEMHIDEELINLQESLDSFRASGDTLKRYPHMYTHYIRERELILRHCIGLVVRMLCGKRLPYAYTADDAEEAIKRLIQLLVDETRRTGRMIDTDTMEIFRPFMTLRQRVALRQWGMDLVMQASQVPKVHSLGSMAYRHARLRVRSAYGSS